MSLLDGLDNKVNEGFFQERKWIHMDLPHFTGYFKTIYEVVKIPGVTDIAHLSFKAIYDSDSKLFTIRSYKPDETMKMEYRSIFNKVSIENPSESEIIVALSPVFLSSRFVKV
jgi:hypothetical protein